MRAPSVLFIAMSSTSRRYAIEADALAGISAGFSRYLQGLIPALTEVLNTEPGNERLVLLQRAKRPIPARFHAAARIDLQLWWGRLWPLRPRFSAVLCPTHRLPPWPLPIVAVVHDFYDEYGIGFEDPRDAAEAIQLRSQLIERAEHLICVSDSTRADLSRFHPAAATKARTVHHGIDARFRPADAAAMQTVRSRYGLERPYLLFLGANRRNKNLIRLLGAYEASGMARHFDLAIAGPKLRAADGDAKAGQMIARALASGAVRSIGFVPDEDLPALYSGARAFLLPSLREGFGLPILEAMACGTAVMTSLGSGCEEVAGGHAILIDPQCERSMADGLQQVIEVDSATRELARSYAGTFRWRDCASQTLATLREASRPFD